MSTSQSSRKHALTMEEPTKNPASYKKQKGKRVTDSEETQSDSSERPETPPPLETKPVERTTLKSPARAQESTTSDGAAKKNAFTELMSKKSKPPPETKKTSASEPSNPYYLSRNDPRSGLATYLINPSSHPKSSVILYNDDFVVINDAYPKATVHALILPRDINITHLEPLVTLNTNPALLSSLLKISAEVRTLLAKELQRIYSKTSKTEQTRQKAFEALEDRAISEPGFDPDSEEAQATLPSHRDWEASIRIGVHARPSMSNFHVHIISEDMHSPCLKKRQHYNSFNTKFFVNLEEFPLEEDDFRIPGEGRTTKGLLESDFVCWKCGRGFGNKFKALKEHLEVEYEAWRKI
ncbi:Aprataxin [Dactylella cylindrospora]|nr:Aprataxin [Dactylella cylindrospora]